MFDRSTTSTVNRTCCIPITFSTSESHTIDLFVTKLDKEYSVVLGYDWLTQHNLSIDWVETKITFHNPETWKAPLEVPSLAPKTVDIWLVSKRTMDRICQEAGSAMFLLSPSGAQWIPNPFQTSLDWLEAKAALTTQLEDPLSRVPQEYHKFCNVFSGKKANMLALPWPYDLKINLEEGTKPFHGLSHLQNWQCSGNSWKRTSRMVSSTPASHHGVLWYYSSRKRMAASTYVLISMH